jgi:hypothetical protein
VDGAAAVLANRRLAYFVAFWISGNPGARLGAFAVMGAYGVLLLVGERSEIVKVLRGQPSDKRYQIIRLASERDHGHLNAHVISLRNCSRNNPALPLTNAP